MAKLKRHNAYSRPPMPIPTVGGIAAIETPKPTPPSNPPTMPAIQPEPVVIPPAETPAPTTSVPLVLSQLMPQRSAIDEMLDERGLTRRDVAYKLRGLAMPWRGWQVDFVTWADPLVVSFVHDSGAQALVACDVTSFPSEGMEREIIAKLSAVP